MHLFHYIASTYVYTTTISWICKRLLKLHFQMKDQNIYGSYAFNLISFCKQLCTEDLCCKGTRKTGYICSYKVYWFCKLHKDKRRNVEFMKLNSWFMEHNLNIIGRDLARVLFQSIIDIGLVICKELHMIHLTCFTVSFAVY